MAELTKERATEIIRQLTEIRRVLRGLEKEIAICDNRMAHHGLPESCSYLSTGASCVFRTEFNLATAMNLTDVIKKLINPN